MDFMQSETRINLARAFAGESQARNRYTITPISPEKKARSIWRASFWKRQTMKRCMERNFWR